MFGGQVGGLSPKAGTQLKSLRDDLGAIFFIAFLVLPGPCLDSPLNVGHFAFGEILGRDLGEAPKSHDIVKFRLGLFLSVFGPDAVGRQTKRGDGLTGGERTHLRIARQIAYQQDFVQIHIISRLSYDPRISSSLLSMVAMSAGSLFSARAADGLAVGLRRAGFFSVLDPAAVRKYRRRFFSFFSSSPSSLRISERAMNLICPKTASLLVLME